MLGWAVAVLLVLAVFLVAVAARVPCHLQEGWVRAQPAGGPLAVGTARSLFQVLRHARRAGARSFNYTRSTRYYELFSDYLVNFTMPGPGFAPGQPGPFDTVTGVVVRPGEAVPAPCCEKIKCEMRMFGLDPDGKMQRDWDRAGPYYDVAKAAQSWQVVGGRAVPPDKQGKSDQFIDHDLTAALKAPGAQAPGAKPAAECGGQCDFCQERDAAGRCVNRAAQYWKGCAA